MQVRVLDATGPLAWILVFDEGDEVISALTGFAREQELRAAHFQAIGGFSEAALGYFDRMRADQGGKHGLRVRAAGTSPLHGGWGDERGGQGGQPARRLASFHLAATSAFTAGAQVEPLARTRQGHVHDTQLLFERRLACFGAADGPVVGQ